MNKKEVLRLKIKVYEEVLKDKKNASTILKKEQKELSKVVDSEYDDKKSQKK